MLETVQAARQNRPELREVICFDDWDDFIAAGDDETIKLPVVGPDDPVMIQYVRHDGLSERRPAPPPRICSTTAPTLPRPHGRRSGDVFVIPMPSFHTAVRLLRHRRGIESRNDGYARSV